MCLIKKIFIYNTFIFGIAFPLSLNAHGFIFGPNVKYGPIIYMSKNKFKEKGTNIGKNLQMGLTLGWMYNKNRFFKYGIILECNYSYKKISFYDLSFTSLFGNFPKDLATDYKKYGKVGLKRKLNKKKIADIRFNSIILPIYFKLYLPGFIFLIGPRFTYIIKRYEKLKKYLFFDKKSDRYKNMKIDLDIKLGTSFSLFGIEPSFVLSTSWINNYFGKQELKTINYKLYIPIISCLFELSWNPLYLIPKRKKGFKDKLRRSLKKAKIKPNRNHTIEPIKYR